MNGWGWAGVVVLVLLVAVIAAIYVGERTDRFHE